MTMSHLQFIDELVKEYLLFRGLSQTLRTLDNELKLEKDKGLRVDRLVDQITNYIQTYDLISLRDLWRHLEKRIFIRLPHNLYSSVKKFEISILRLYVINTIQTNKSDKLLEFFEKMAPDLQNHVEWREWFVLPYLRSIEDNPTFAMYFSKQWQDTLFVSLHNFLATVYQNLELPTLARYTEEATKVARLTDEVEGLRIRLSALTNGDQVPPEPPPSPEIRQVMDDFYNIAQETPINEGQLKSFKNLLFGFGGGLPPPPNQSRPQISSSSLLSQQTQQQPRRSPSNSSSLEKPRPRSSSLAPSTSRNNNSEQGSRRVVPSASPSASSSASRQSRSPTKSHSIQDDTITPSSQSPFLLIGQDEYCEHRNTGISHTVFNPSGTLVASADNEGVVKVWSPSPSPKTHCGVVLKNAVTSVEWFPKNEKYLLVATKAASVKLFDTQEKKTIWDVNQENCSVLKDQRIMTVKVTPNESTAVLSVFPRSRHAAMSPNHSASILHMLDMKTAKIESSYNMDGSVVNGSSLNHNGGLMVCGCHDGTVKIIDLRCPDVIATWPAHQGEVFTVKLSSQENLIYTIGSDNRFACWSMAQTGARILDHSLHERAAGPFLVSANSGSNSSSASVSSGTGGGRSVLLRPYGPLFALHSDGKHLFTCSSNGSIIYKITDDALEKQMRLQGHKSPVITLDWSKDLQCGTCIAGSIDGRITVSTIMSQ